MGADVIVTGDVFTTTQYPFIDLQNGGSVRGEIDALNDILKRTVYQHEGEGGTIVVPGHGEVSDVTLLHDVRGYLEFVRGEAQRLQGKDLAAATAEISAAARDRWPDWANPEWIDFAVRICFPAQ